MRWRLPIWGGWEDKKELALTSLTAYYFGPFDIFSQHNDNGYDPLIVGGFDFVVRLLRAA